MIDELKMNIEVVGVDIFDEFDRALERMSRAIVNAIVLARGSTPAEAIAHRMERAG